MGRADDERLAADAWRAFVAALGEAGERRARQTEGLSPEERADGFRALHNQLARFEVDRERPELVAARDGLRARGRRAR